MEGKERIIEIPLSMGNIKVILHYLGEDLCILLQGGERPHIGCIVISMPRESLRGDGSVSCTSSVFNLLGHKEEEICRKLAEEVSKRKNKTVVCTGGFHVDAITVEQIQEIMVAVERIAAEI